MRRLVPLVMAAAVLAPTGVSAQDATPVPTPEPHTFCVTVSGVGGYTTPELLMASIRAGVLTVTEVDVACDPDDTLDGEGAAESAAPDVETSLIPLGSEGRFDNWSATISKVNDNGWKAVRAENQFNDAPPKGTRIVLVTFKLRNESEDQAIDPSFNVEAALYSKSTGDGFDAYDGVTPGNGIYGDNIPPGRNRAITLAYVVPKSVDRSDLSLYVAGSSEYVEMDLAPAR